MKRFNSIIAIIGLAIVAIAVAFVSCKKEKQEQKLYNVGQSTNFDNTDEYLLSFKEKLLSAEKGDEFISLEQAQRDLCNLLNFDFGDANYISNLFHYDTLCVNLAITEGMVDLSQLSVAYEVSREMIAKVYEQVNLPEKTISTIFSPIAPETGDGETVDLVFVLTTRGFDSGTRNLTVVPSWKNSIDATDCWHVARGLGRCDNTDVGYDHHTILQLVYNNNVPLYGCINHGYLYYTDINEGTIVAASFPETGTPIYNLGYRLWTGFYSGWYSGLVSSDEMSYYYENLCDIIDDKMDELNDNEYRIINIWCSVTAEPNSNKYSFVCKYKYGKPHCAGGPLD